MGYCCYACEIVYDGAAASELEPLVGSDLSSLWVIKAPINFLQGYWHPEAVEQWDFINMWGSNWTAKDLFLSSVWYLMKL